MATNTKELEQTSRIAATNFSYPDCAKALTVLYFRFAYKI